MLFNSYDFIFLFLPIVLFGFFQLARINHGWATGWLVLASLFFYGYWNPAYIGLLLGSIMCNYAFGLWISQYKAPDSGSKAVRAKQLLIIALAANLGLLGYYKYAHFFVGNLALLLGKNWSLGEIILPLGISFFTFTQIAFLVDVYQGKVKEFNFTHYILFVTYFPHLIAGPIMHHKELMPQFAKPEIYRFNYENLAVGSTLFFIGLFKKTILADNISAYVTSVFAASGRGVELPFVDAWSGALYYSFQLYFDFSGYSDMAIGLSRMFGVTLPANFYSPYKSVNIIEFWRRWHMTLSRFLRDYLYIPLGGNQNSMLRRCRNLIITCLLGGLWHGADWTFVLWGGLHGFYVVINHVWHKFRQAMGQNIEQSLSWPLHALSVLVTFLAVTVAWVIFRSPDIHTAIAILKAMAGFYGYALPHEWLSEWGAVGQWLSMHGIIFNAKKVPEIAGMDGMINWMVVFLFIVWMAPNTQQIMAIYKPVLGMTEEIKLKFFLWRPTYIFLGISILVAVAGISSISALSEFIYFQF